MADKKPEAKSSGDSGMSFELQVVLFVVGIFVLWVFTGGAQKPVEEKPFITPLSDTENPGVPYGFKNTNNN